MLNHSDLHVFVELLRIAEREAKPSPTINPHKVLRAEAPAADLLHRNELSGLRCSLKIASVAGDAPEPVHRILHRIVRDLSREGFIYLPLTCSKQWLDALALALHHTATPATDYLPHPAKYRQWVRHARNETTARLQNATIRPYRKARVLLAPGRSWPAISRQSSYLRSRRSNVENR